MSEIKSPKSTIAQYTIVSKIGEGGMGQVYRARDTRLDREVAIKLLPAEVSSDPDRLKRFEQEARATSALNHPNILTVYDIGRVTGGRYQTMEVEHPHGAAMEKRSSLCLPTTSSYLLM